MGTISATLQGQPIYIKEGSLNISENLNNRSTASFVLEGTTLFNVNEGDEVIITRESDSETLFAGNVLNTRFANDFTTTFIGLRLNCTSYEYLPDRRIVAEVYITETTGNIIADLIDKYLDADGVTPGTIEQGISLNRAVFNYKRLSDVLNQLAEANGMVWYIDYAKQLHFIERQYQVAPYEIDETDNTKKAIRGVSVDASLSNYTNKRFIEYLEQTSLQTETFAGDGERTVFTTAFPVVKTPVAKVNGVTKTVGILGLDSAKNFYWSKNSNEITQEAGDTKLRLSNTTYPPLNLKFEFTNIDHDFGQFSIKDVYAYNDLVIIGRNDELTIDKSGYAIYKNVEGVYKQVNNLYLTSIGSKRIEKIIGMGDGFISLEQHGIDGYRWRYYGITQDGINLISTIQDTTATLRWRFLFASGRHIAGNDASSVLNSTFQVKSIATDGTVTNITGLDTGKNPNDTRYFLGYDGGFCLVADSGGFTSPPAIKQFSIDGNTYTTATAPPAATGTIELNHFAQTQGYFVLKTSAGLELYTRTGFTATLTKATAVTLPAGYTFRSGSYNIFFNGKILWVAVNESPYFLQYVINASNQLEILPVLGMNAAAGVVKYSIYEEKLILVSEASRISTVTQLFPPDILQIEYYGSFPSIEIVDDATQITERATIEGGTGLYETFQSINEVEEQSDIITLGQAILDKLGRVPKIFNFETRLEGLKIGDTISINWPTLGINDQEFLVESCNIKDISASVLFYQYKVISGINSNSWQEFWKSTTESQVTRLNSTDVITKAESVSDLIAISDILEVTEDTADTNWDHSHWDYFEWQT